MERTTTAEYYWMNREYGYFLLQSELMTDAIKRGYDKISMLYGAEYDMISAWYEKTDLRAR